MPAKTTPAATSGGTGGTVTSGISTLTYNLVDTATNIQTRTITKNNPGKIVINLRNPDGTPRVNEIVTISTTKGELYPADGLALTDNAGQAVIDISDNNQLGVGVITIYIDEETSATLNFQILEDSGSTTGTISSGFLVTFDLLDPATGDPTTNISESSPGVIEVLVRDNDKKPLDRQIVTIATDKGVLSPADGKALTGADGVARIDIKADNDEGVGLITVTHDEKEYTPLPFAIVAGTGTALGASFPYEFSLVDPADGTSEIKSISKNKAGIIIIDVIDDGTPHIREVVTFTTDKGTLYPSDGKAMTDSLGHAYVEIKAGDDLGVGQITVTVGEKTSDPLPFVIIEDSASWNLEITNFNLIDPISGDNIMLISKSSPGQLVVEVVKPGATAGTTEPAIREIVAVTTTKGSLFPEDGLALTDDQGKAIFNLKDNDQLGAGIITATAGTVNPVESDPLNFAIIEDTGSSTAGSTNAFFNLYKPYDPDDPTNDNPITEISSEAPGELRIYVEKSTGDPAKFKVVEVKTTKGVLYPADGLALTDDQGNATISLKDNSEIGVGQITVTVDDEVYTPLPFKIVEATGTAVGISSVSYWDLVDPDPSYLNPPRIRTITKNNPGKVVINVIDSLFQPAKEQIVTVTTTIGVLDPPNGLALTDATGKAEINLYDNDQIGVGTITVSVDGVVDETVVNFEIIEDGELIAHVACDLIDPTTLPVITSMREISKNNAGRVMVTLTDSSGNGVSGQIVTVSTTKGLLSPPDGLAVTDDDGTAYIDITDNNQIGVGVLTVTVNGKDNAPIYFEIADGSINAGVVADVQITMSTDNSDFKISKEKSGKVQVAVSDALGNPLGRRVVTVSTTKGTLFPTDGLALTNSAGIAEIDIKAGEVLGVGVITASCDTYEGDPLNFEIIQDTGTSTGGSSNATFDLVDSTNARISKISSEAPGKIVVNVTDNGGGPVVRKIVTVAATKGALYPEDGMALTDAAGQAVITISDNNQIGAGEITVTVDDVVYGPLNFEIVSATSALPTLLVLTSSQTSVLSNNADSATITATVIKDNVPLEDVTVYFSSNGGLMSKGSAITTFEGKAEIDFTSGPDAQNEIINITATAPGVSDQIPVQITGNKITLSSDQSNIGVGVDASITLSLKNAVPLGIANKIVTLTLEETPETAGNAVLTPLPATVTTDVYGTAQISVTGLNPGIAIIKASGMGALGALSVVVTAPEDVFEITAPTTAEAEEGLGTDETVDVVVNVPLSGGAPSMANVTFVTTVGCFGNVGPGCGAGGTSSKTVAVVQDTPTSASATATLSSDEAGTTTIEVRDAINFDTYDTLQLDFYAPPSEAYQISLSATPTVVAPSPGETKNSISLTATVTNQFDQVVGDAIVNFTISNNPVGGGEQISPASVKTDSSGVASTTFYSGTLSSDGGGLTIQAVIDPYDPITNPEKADTVDVIIGGTAGSIEIGLSNKISSNAENTKYMVDITAQLTDANGNPVPDQIITLNLWPTHYLLGYENVYDTVTKSCYVYNDWPQCSVIIDQPNEDLNKNLVLDPGEDTGSYFDWIAGERVMIGDTYLTPHNSAAGSIPATVVTDVDGFATFQHTYLKQNALWVRVRLTASVNVLGTETQASKSWVLRADKGEMGSQCDLFNSPYGYYRPDINFVTAASSPVSPTVGSLVTLTATSTPQNCADNLAIWTFISRPNGSTVELDDPALSNPTFTPDVIGSYELLLSITSAGVIKTDIISIDVAAAP